MTEGQATHERSALWEPTVGECYGNGWRQMWQYPLELLLIAIVYFLIHLPESIGSAADEMSGATGAVLGLLAFAYSVLLSWPLGFGISFGYLRAARGDALHVKDIFAVLQNYWSAVLANLLVMVIVTLGFVFLVVPGIIFACKLAFVSYLVVDRDMEAIEAVKESWRMTTGHAWTIFFMGLLAIPIAVAGVVCLVVGIVPAIWWISLAMASLYHAISEGETIAEQEQANGAR